MCYNLMKYASSIMDVQSVLNYNVIGSVSFIFNELGLCLD